MSTTLNIRRRLITSLVVKVAHLSKPVQSV